MDTGADVIENIEKVEAIRTEIQEQFTEIKFPEPVLEPLYFGRLNKTDVVGKKLILDKNEGTQYDVVSDKYHVVYHEEVVRKLLDSIPEEYGKADTKIKLYKSGARMKIDTLFPEMGEFKVNGSKLDPKIILKNSYDRSLNLAFDFGAEELICTNGLTAFVSKEKGRAKHISGSILNMNLSNTIKTSLDTFSDQHKLWISWAEKELSEIEVKTVIESLPFSEKEKENLMELPLINHSNTSLVGMKKPTLWAINSSATQYAKHEVKGELRKMELDRNITNGMLAGIKKIAA